MTDWRYAADLSTRNLPALIAKRMRPERPFIGDGEGRNLGYGEFWALTGQMAHALGAHGVKPGDRVAAQTEKSIEALALFYATARAGAIYLPLNTAYTDAELGYFLGDAEPSLLVASPARAAPFARWNVLTMDADGSGTFMQATNAQPRTFEDSATGWHDLAAILYTSGTTGRSKGAMLTHGNLASNALALAELWRFSAEDVLLHALPIYHTHGLFTAANTVLMSGGRMIFRPKFDANDVVQRLPQATTMMGVPTFYTRLLQHPAFTRELTAHMRLFISGSAPLLAETHAQFQARTGHAILERYGMTETNMNASNPYEGERRPSTVGFPLPGIALRIADPADGHPLPQGEIGMIEVKGPNVFKGYWRMPEKTAAEFRPDGFFITGDLGQVSADGYVSIVGRGKDLIITGGFNVYPKEVEQEIDAIPGVVESAVFGLPHPDFGEAVTAAVVLRPDGPSERAILAALETRLARFKLPKRVLALDSLPRNAMGKVQKTLLRQTYANLYESLAGRRTP